MVSLWLNFPLNFRIFSLILGFSDIYYWKGIWDGINCLLTDQYWYIFHLRRSHAGQSYLAVCLCVSFSSWRHLEAREAWQHRLLRSLSLIMRPDVTSEAVWRPPWPQRTSCRRAKDFSPRQKSARGLSPTTIWLFCKKIELWGYWGCFEAAMASEATKTAVRGNMHIDTGVIWGQIWIMRLLRLFWGCHDLRGHQNGC